MALLRQMAVVITTVFGFSALILACSQGALEPLVVVIEPGSEDDNSNDNDNVDDNDDSVTELEDSESIWDSLEDSECCSDIEADTDANGTEIDTSTLVDADTDSEIQVDTETALNEDTETSQTDQDSDVEQRTCQFFYPVSPMLTIAVGGTCHTLEVDCAGQYYSNIDCLPNEGCCIRDDLCEKETPENNMSAVGMCMPMSYFCPTVAIDKGCSEGLKCCFY